jgi:hypothetical protein
MISRTVIGIFSRIISTTGIVTIPITVVLIIHVAIPITVALIIHVTIPITVVLIILFHV